MSGRSELPDEFMDLVDLYCSGLIDETGLVRLEAILLGSERARRDFVAYLHHHAEIHFAIRAGRAADSVLTRLSSAAGRRGPRRLASWRRPWRSVARSRRWLGAAVIVALVTVLAAAIRLGAPLAASRWGSSAAAKSSTAGSAAVTRSSTANVAWLVNAQDCRWMDKDQTPGRDMRPGKTLRLERGLAEIEFDRGARIILQGPAGLDLLSGSAARLLYGTLTARVPAQARGFTVLSPGGRVVDLGTEFGLSVNEAGATTVRVFKGEVEAFPLAANAVRDRGVTVHQDQIAQIARGTVAVDSSQPETDAVTYVRAILPPPILTPRSLRLDFTRPVAGTILDVEGRGIGLTHRLKGTGSSLPQRDPNLRLRPDRRALELTTTRSDLNTQDRMPTGEYLGFRLADLGFTGKEDFEISATIPNIPGLKVVGQFGLYAGARSDTNIRGGLIRRPDPDSYRLFLVNNSKGEDDDIYEVGLMTTGDDLRLTLRRMGGRYSLVVDNLTRNSSSTLEIAHSAFLDAEMDMYAGLFGANTQSDLRKTLTIREVNVTVWTRQPDNPTVVQGPTRH
jgi:hypothetical protein